MSSHRLPLASPIAVVVICRMCGHIYEEWVREKTTTVCEKCRTPTDLWADGRSAPSPLFEVRGEVLADPHASVCTGFGFRGMFVATREWVRKTFGF